MERIISWFDELTKDDIPLVGGKGANLGEMSRAGFPIPPGFVVNVNGYSEFLEDVNLKYDIMDILEDTDVHNSEQLEDNAEKIRNMITGGMIASRMIADMIPKCQRSHFRKVRPTDRGIDRTEEDRVLARVYSPQTLRKQRIPAVRSPFLETGIMICSQVRKGVQPSISA